MLRIVAIAFFFIVPCIVAAVWIRSLWWCDQFQVDPDPFPVPPPRMPLGSHQLILRTQGGGFLLVWSTWNGLPGSWRKPVGKTFSLVSDQDVEYPLTNRASPSVHRAYTLIGFELCFGGWQSPRGQNRYTRLTLPLWFLFLLSASPMSLFSLRLYHRRQHAHRLRNHLCPACAYDLRASKDRCPECGTTIHLPSPTSAP